MLILLVLLMLILFGGESMLETFAFDLKLFVKDVEQFEGERGELQPQS